MSRYGVFSGPYFPVFGLNTGIYSVRIQESTDQKKLRFWTLFTQYQNLHMHCCGWDFIMSAVEKALNTSLSMVKAAWHIFQFEPGAYVNAPVTKGTQVWNSVPTISDSLIVWLNGLFQQLLLIWSRSQLLLLCYFFFFFNNHSQRQEPNLPVFASSLMLTNYHVPTVILFLQSYKQSGNNLLLKSSFQPTEVTPCTISPSHCSFQYLLRLKRYDVFSWIIFTQVPKFSTTFSLLQR